MNCRPIWTDSRGLIVAGWRFDFYNRRSTSAVGDDCRRSSGGNLRREIPARIWMQPLLSFWWWRLSCQKESSWLANCLNAEDVYKLVQYSFVVSIWDWNLIEKMKILQVVGVLFLNKSSNVSFVRCRWQPLYQLIGSNSSRDSRRWSRHTRVAKEEHCIAICNAFKEKRRMLILYFPWPS